MGRVQDKVAVVSGGAAGLGAASCRALAREGAKIVIGDLRAEPGEALAGEITAAGGQAIFQHLDVRSEESWQALTERTLTQFGKMNVLFNNAGVALPTGDVEHLSLEDWHAVMAVNSDGVFLGVKHAVRTIRRSGEPGSIINTSSIMGLVGMATATAYTAAKGAVRLLTKTAALYCAKSGYDIRVNSIHPGFISTDMLHGTLAHTETTERRLKEIAESTPMGRLGEPMDIAYGVLYLASDESKYMTGAELVIDGGYTAQ